MAGGARGVSVASEPSGAIVRCNGEPVGITPCEVPVTVGARWLELDREGFHRQIVDVGTRRNPWVVGNVATLGVGLLVDLGLGHDRVPDARPVVVHLRSLDAPAPGPWLRPRMETAEVAPREASGLGNLVAAILQELACRGCP
jgi:hypothetical protein